MNDIPEPPVGPYNPPKEHRWKKGQPSPNPHGRPPKKKLMQLSAGVDKHAELIDNFGSTPLLGKDGETMEFRTQFLKAYAELAFDKKTPPKVRLDALHMLIETDRDAQRLLDEERLKQFNIAMDYKEKYTEVFETAERQGDPLPKMTPDPRDVLIHDDGRVSIVGPKTPQQQAAIEQLLNNRAVIMEAFVLTAGNPPSEQRTKDLKYCQYRLRDINKRLQPRLRRPIPRLPRDENFRED